MSRDENHPERLEVGIELVDQWSADRDHPARDTITGTSAKYFANGQLILDKFQKYHRLQEANLDVDVVQKVATVNSVRLQSSRCTAPHLSPKGKQG